MEVFISAAPKGLKTEFNQLLNNDSIEFISSIYREFRHQLEELYSERQRRSYEIKSGEWKNPPSSEILNPLSASEEGEWMVDSVPLCLQDRRLDLGDVSPANSKHFASALRADVQGIQVDFDDGHSPTWFNEIKGHFNVWNVVHNRFPSVPKIENSPVLMFRPRAWNIIEHNFLVDGKAIPGAIFDFALHVFKNAKTLSEIKRGPFFYLSKTESAKEAEIWDAIFVWTERKLNLPFGTIKACVLIEDILAAFEMDKILYALRHHSAGLNCGIWDYCASIVARFGDQPEFLLPDRNKYVNMDKKFLKKYMALAVSVCQRRGTFVTGGMAALMADSPGNITKVVTAKRKEITAGVSGFMVYDIRLVPEIRKLWLEFNDTPVKKDISELIRVGDLLEIPKGGVTLLGLDHNIKVTLLFIQNWMAGVGHFVYKSAVEDSATAEISRWQVYQWIIHKAEIEEMKQPVTFNFVTHMVSAISKQLKTPPIVSAIYFRLLTLQSIPQFITTFVSDNYLFSSLPNLENISKL